LRDIVLFGYGKNGKAVSKYLDKKSFLIIVYDEEEKEDAIYDGHLNIEFFDDIYDEDLKSIGITNAKIAICMLEDEARNMFLALSIRELNKDINIIAKTNQEESVHRYKLAGVNQIINSYEITAKRIESILKKPATLEFIHKVVFSDENLVFAQVEILENSFLDNKYIKEITIEETYNLIIIGILDKERSDKLELIGDYNHKLNAKDVLVVVGDKNEVERLKLDMEEWVKWHSQ
jgi:Trk K+ transport system NAD-binding subunit